MHKPIRIVAALLGNILRWKPRKYLDLRQIESFDRLPYGKTHKIGEIKGR